MEYKGWSGGLKGVILLLGELVIVTVVRVRQWFCREAWSADCLGLYFSSSPELIVGRTSPDRFRLNEKFSSPASRSHIYVPVSTLTVIRVCALSLSKFLRWESS